MQSTVPVVSGGQAKPSRIGVDCILDEFMFVCDVFGRKIFAMSGSKSRIQASGADKAVILHISSDFPLPYSILP